MTDFPFVPGFTEALERSETTRALREEGVGFACRLSQRGRALVGLAVAQATGGEYALWANTVRARAAGLSEEEIVLACAGTAEDDRERFAVRLARVAARMGIADASYDNPESAATLAAPEIQAVLGMVAQCLLDNALLRSLAPRVHKART